MLNRRSILLLFWLTTIEGIFLFLLSFSTPSEAGNAWLWGYSKARLLLLAWMLGCVFLSLGLTGKAAWDRRWFEKLVARLEVFLASASNLLLVSMLLGGVLFVLAALLPLAFSLFRPDLGTLLVLLARLRFMLGWGFLIFLQAIVFLAATYRSAYRCGDFWNPVLLGRFFISAGVLGLSVFHWTILSLQLTVYSRLSGWFFAFHPRSFEGREWLFPLLLIGFLLLIYFSKFLLRGWRGLVLLMIWAYVLQMGFMWMDWGGLARMSDQYLLRYSVYADVVSTAPPPLEQIRNYQDLYSHNNYTGTKAPGFLLSYWASQELASRDLPNPTPADKTMRLSVFITLVYPALAALALIPLLALSRTLLGVERQNLALLTFLSFPGILLISLVPDQTFYPFLFALMIWLAILLAEKGNFWMAVGLGALLYLALFMAFALLPAVFMVFLLIGLHYLLFNQNWPSLKRYLLLILGLGLGLAIVYVAFSALLGYDALARYFQALESHRRAKAYPDGLAFLPATILLNNLDFGLGAGFPTLFMLLIAFARSLSAIIRKQITRLDWVTISYLGMFLVLNVVGQTRSETARLWLFLLPLAAIFEIDLLDRVFTKHSSWLYWLIALQLLTTFFIFKYQGFY